MHATTIFTQSPPHGLKTQCLVIGQYMKAPQPMTKKHNKADVCLATFWYWPFTSRVLGFENPGLCVLAGYFDSWHPKGHSSSVLCWPSSWDVISGHRPLPHHGREVIFENFNLLEKWAFWPLQPSKIQLRDFKIDDYCRVFDCCGRCF